MKEPVGVYGGTFDPVHLGHLGVAESVRRVFALDRVVLMPAFVAPHKTGRPVSPAVHRIAMLRLAILGRSGLAVSTFEVDGGEVAYTIDTLRALRGADPGIDPLFIVGMDSLSEIGTWRDHDALLREFDLVAVDRPGESLDGARHRLAPEHAGRLVAVPFEDGAGRRAAGPARPGAGGRIFHVPMPLIDVSSSRVRAVSAAGAPLDGLVPPEVAGYIRAQGLYAEETAR